MQLASGPRVIDVLNTLAAAALDKRHRALHPTDAMPPIDSTPQQLKQLLHTHAAVFARTAATMQQQQVLENCCCQLVQHHTWAQVATRDVLAHLDTAHAELTQEEQQIKQVR